MKKISTPLPYATSQLKNSVLIWNWLLIVARFLHLFIYFKSLKYSLRNYYLFLESHQHIFSVFFFFLFPFSNVIGSNCSLREAHTSYTMLKPQTMLRMTSLSLLIHNLYYRIRLYFASLIILNLFSRFFST